MKPKEGQIIVYRNESKEPDAPPYRGGLILGGLVYNVWLYVFEKDERRWMSGYLKQVDKL